MSTDDSTPAGEPLLTSDPTPDAPERLQASERRRFAAGIAFGTIVAGGALALFSQGGSDSVEPAKPDIPLDAWAPYWTLDNANQTAELRLASMREVSPFWFNATGVDQITLDPNANADAIEEFMSLAERSGVAVVPSIVDALGASEMAGILADPETRTRHVAAIVAFVEDGDYDGVDLDYERFAFVDGRDTWETTRPNWVAFIEELSIALRADDRTLTVSIPPVYDDGRTGDSGFWVYDHGAISEFVDRIRIMAYDFSVGEPGPIAPLSFTQNSIDGALATVSDPDKIVLGVPLYGRNWPTGVTGDCPAGTELEDTQSVNNATVDDLIERRGATPTFDDVTGEWSFVYEIEFTDGVDTCTQTREVHYVDADGARLRMDLAREAQLGGVSLWAYGFDDEQVWEEILPTVDQE